ncbi:hypothetical protein FOXB_15558 [Fusarium oxysporum f. sp. conglutinans Fo5176]|uniref:Uncharacterized protein n=1 Tax=Fusarium oxysporum (strain Fo5176) TaxID=660025 RepID=F9GA76_FUSOF|nr:hypothetical protein FOXB_15558 [Fusarium oxysporum f. sp. conglutinans Fo5176]
MTLDVPMEIDIEDVSLSRQAATVVGLRHQPKYEEADMLCHPCWRVVRGLDLTKK